MSRRLGILALCALLAGLAWTLLDHSRLPTGAATPARAEAGGEASEAVAGGPPPGAAVPAPADPANPQPAANASSTPAEPRLLSDLALLDARAAAGDRSAAWQAYTAIQKCRERRAHDRFVRAVEDAAPDTPLASYRRELGGAVDAAHTRYCAGSEALGPAAAFERLLKLAEAGDLDAQLQFVLDPPIYRRRALIELDLILRYRERAPALLQRALEAGSVQALAALLDAHTPALHLRREDSLRWSSRPEQPEPAESATAYRRELALVASWRDLPHRQILVPDLAQAYIFALACQRVCTDGVPLEGATRTIAWLEGTLPAQQRLELRAAADQLVRDAFSGRVEERRVNPGEWWNTL